MNRRIPFLALAFTASLGASWACTGDDPRPILTDGPEDAGSGMADSSNGGCEPTESACDGLCVDTTSVAAHCGACGRSCGGGSCSNGTCEPVVVATSVAEPLGVAVTAGSAFWLRQGAVERCSVTGCDGAPFVITAEVDVGAAPPDGTTIVTDGAQVAWIAAGGANLSDIYACGVVGCPNGFSPKTATGLTARPTQLAIESSTLFAVQDLGKPRSGSMSTLQLTAVELSTDGPRGVAADATYLYVAGFQQSAMGVDRCTRTSGACESPTRLFAGARHLAAGGGAVFATSDEGIKMCAGTGCGGAATILDANAKDAAAIAADASFVAWVIPGDTASATGSVRACKVPDCAGGPRTVASAQARPASVTLADGFVYWANRGVDGGSGSIWRAAL